MALLTEYPCTLFRLSFWASSYSLIRGLVRGICSNQLPEEIDSSRRRSSLEYGGVTTIDGDGLYLRHLAAIPCTR
jgi:hypothetical protein